MDPRPAVIERRLATVTRIIAVTGGKGGIGKSSVSVGLALSFAARGLRVGLLDLDLCGPSDHVILGQERPTFEEDGGLVPMVVHGVTFMSITGIVGADAALLRGEDVTNAILELLAVTRWGTLDTLVVDMPPGFGDTLLDSARYLPRAEYVVVATPSALVLETTRKTVALLRRLGLPMLGLVENMSRDGAAAPGGPDEATGGLPWLGVIPFDAGYEAALAMSPACEPAGSDAGSLPWRRESPPITTPGSARLFRSGCPEHHPGRGPARETRATRRDAGAVRRRAPMPSGPPVPGPWSPRTAGVPAWSACDPGAAGCRRDPARPEGCPCPARMLAAPARGSWPWRSWSP